MKRILFVIIGIFVGSFMGCSFNATLKAKSAAAIGCAPSDIRISDKKYLQQLEGYTFRATCNGKVFYCENSELYTKCMPVH